MKLGDRESTPNVRYLKPHSQTNLVDGPNYSKWMKTGPRSTGLSAAPFRVFLRSCVRVTTDQQPHQTIGLVATTPCWR
jgi:hypothetical protein